MFKHYVDFVVIKLKLKGNYRTAKNSNLNYGSVFQIFELMAYMNYVINNQQYTRIHCTLKKLDLNKYLRADKEHRRNNNDLHLFQVG